MFENEKKSLYIVTDEKNEVYAQLLAALITQKDDGALEDGNDKENVVGVRDGSVEATVWLDNNYADNKVQMNSNNYILFIGECKSASIFIDNISTKNDMSNYGIHIGNLGNKAVLYAEKKVLTKNKELYNDFFEAFSNYIQNEQSNFGKTSELSKSVRVTEKIDNAATKLNNGINKGINGGINGVKGLTGRIKSKVKKEEYIAPEKKDIVNIPKVATNIVAGAMALPFAGLLEIGAVATVLGVKKANSDKEIADQQMRFATIKFYMEHLARFMEID